MGRWENRLFGTSPRTSHARVVDELGRAIVGGALAEGTILPGDQALMERYGVSRTVLREAMKTLAAKRLIAAKSRVGTRVRPREDWNFVDGEVIGWRLQAGMDRAFLEELAEMRMALEPATAALAARRATLAEAATLLALAGQMGDPAHSRESIAEVDLAFHLAIATMARNPFMRSVSSLIEAALAVSFKLSSPALSAEGIADCATNHRAIAEAIGARDEDRAALTMRHVIVVGMNRVAAVLTD